MRCYWQGEYRTQELEFDPLHKGDWVAQSLMENPIKGVEVLPAPLASREDILGIHEEKLIDALITGQPRGLAESAGIGWEEKLWPALQASAGGALAAAADALSMGSAMSLSSGSHHALSHRGRGMCCINDLALVAHRYQHMRVMIIDFDAHGGGGTREIVERMPNVFQADVSISMFDRTYTRGNFYAHLCRDTEGYFQELIKALKWATSKRPQFCIYNGGMDVHEDSAQNAKTGITTEIIARREQMVAQWCENFKIPVVGFLSGGYVSDKLSRERLVNLHRLTVENLAPLADRWGKSTT